MGDADALGLICAVQHLERAAIWHGAGSIPAAVKAGSLPPVKARRRQNAIDQPKRCKQSGKPIRRAARRQTAAGLREPEKVCPHSEVRNKTSTADRGTGINNAEHRGTARYTKRQPASPVRTIQGIKKALRICYPQRVRPAQHKPVGRVRGMFEKRWERWQL